VVAGGGGKGYLYERYINARGEFARFARPGGIAVAQDGVIFVADTYNNAIRRITSDGAVTTLAGASPKK
jgi:glucose/arabinose dehydrogenase